MRGGRAWVREGGRVGHFWKRLKEKEGWKEEGEWWERTGKGREKEEEVKLRNGEKRKGVGGEGERRERMG